MMLKNRFVSVVVLLAATGMLMISQPAKAADADAAPKVSTFAPAEDLANQADKYLDELEQTVATEADYKDGQDKIARDANTLIVVALALGLHDQDSKYKASAGAVTKAAGELAATKDFDAAKKAVAAIKDAAEGKGQAGGELKWEKVASLGELMKQVPVINTKLKLNVKGSKFKKKAKDTAGYTAVIAVIAQGSMADTSATKSPDQVKQWQGFSTAMRDHAGTINAAIHKGDQDAADAAMKKLAQSCDDCHDVFHKGEK
jgi:cytochrome c556